MTPEDVKLREAALAATPGPWEVHEKCIRRVEYRRYIAMLDWNNRDALDNHNAAYIAAANPATILQLLDRVEGVEKERDDFAVTIVTLGNKRDKLLDEVERLRAALRAMLRHSCIVDTASEDKDPEDHLAERLARAALQPSGAGK